MQLRSSSDIALEHSLRRSASHLMTDKVPIIPFSYTLADARALIADHIKDLESINYLYVINEKIKLLGIFSIKDLYRFPDKTRVERIYTRAPLITVLPTADREEVVRVAVRHNLKAVPLGDVKGIL